MTHFDDNLTACARIVEKGDPDRFLATMAAPVAARAVLFPIYAFNVEVARAPYASKEPLVAEMRLQWWWDALEEIAAGAPVRKHEVTVPLAHVLTPEAARLLQANVDARRADARREDPADRTALLAYLRDTSGALMRAAVMALGGGDDRRAGDVGTASGLANYLLAVPALKAAGRSPFPEMSRSDFGALIADVARAARSHRGRGSRPQRIAELSAWRMERILGAALKRPESVPSGGLAGSEAGRRITLFLRALRI